MGVYRKKGLWWLPGRDDAKVLGELRLSADEFVLELQGGLAKNASNSASGEGIATLFQPVIEPVVLGIAENREEVTILESEGSRHRFPWRRVTPSGIQRRL